MHTVQDKMWPVVYEPPQKGHLPFLPHILRDMSARGGRESGRQATHWLLSEKLWAPVGGFVYCRAELRMRGLRKGGAECLLTGQATVRKNWANPHVAIIITVWLGTLKRMDIYRQTPIHGESAGVEVLVGVGKPFSVGPPGGQRQKSEPGTSLELTLDCGDGSSHTAHHGSFTSFPSSSSFQKSLIEGRKVVSGECNVPSPGLTWQEQLGPFCTQQSNPLVKGPRGWGLSTLAHTVHQTYKQYRQIAGAQPCLIDLNK